MFPLRNRHAFCGNFLPIEEVWTAYEKGLMPVEEFPIISFSCLFDEFGIRHDAARFNMRYLAELGKGTFLIEGAEEICEAIVSAGKKIYIDFSFYEDYPAVGRMSKNMKMMADWQ